MGHRDRGAGAAGAIAVRRRAAEANRDPDTDDDGLTDGQEVKYVTQASNGVGKDTSVSGELDDVSPLDPDSDGDGWWDGWIGVYDAGYNSRNVVLYMEHLRDEDRGIQPDEMVQAQVGVHGESEAPIPDERGADIDSDDEREHSNVHLGELYWETDSTDESSAPVERTHLEVEVDYIENRAWPNDGDPSAITNTNGVSVLEAASQNYALYGVDVEFVVDNPITRSELRNTCKAIEKTNYAGGTEYEPCWDPDDPRAINVTPDDLNRWELAVIEDNYHDDDSRMHLLWGTELGNDEPKTVIDDRMDYDDANPTGIARHTGASNAEKVGLIENDFGVMVARDRFPSSDYRGLQSVTMHELGHALSLGWRDDAPIPYLGFACEKCFEVYSGNGDPDLTGGVDPINETIIRRGGTESEWSVMMAGTAPDARGYTTTTVQFPIIALSVEELSTLDFEHVPSRDD